MTDSFDILGLGCVAIDSCHLVDEFPREDAKARVVARRKSLGGTTATALAAASRYGARCGFAGFIDHQQVAFVRDEFQRYGVDTSLLEHADGVLPIKCQVIVSRSTSSRTIFFDLYGAQGAAPDWPPPEPIQAAKLLLIDHFGMEGMLRAARIADCASVPIVADFESSRRPEFPALLELVNHLILPQELACEITGCTAAAAACNALWSGKRAAVIVTCGRDGCWYLSPGEIAAVRHEVFPVAAVDTTNCGDVFRGVYAASLVAGLPLTQRIRRASAAAALVAAHPFEDGNQRLPDRQRIEDFLAAQPIASRGN